MVRSPPFQVSGTVPRVVENQPDPLSLLAMREWLVKLSASGCLQGMQIERSAGVGRWISSWSLPRFE